MGMQKKKCRANEEKIRRVTIKLEEETWEVDEEDHYDYCQMFKMLDKEGDILDGLQLMFEEQKKQVEAKSKQGYRWHPRLVPNETKQSASKHKTCYLITVTG